MSLHLELRDLLTKHFGTRMTGDVSLKQDSLAAPLDNGVHLEIRFASPEHYSLEWRHEAHVQRIDTAPTHPKLATSPNHWHRVDGTVVADPLTQPGAAPWDNLQKVVTALLTNPELEPDT